MSRRKWIIKFGAIVFVVALLSLGSFLIYWGSWNYVFGDRIGLFLGPLIGLFGGCAVFLGIIVAISMTKLGDRKWVIAFGASLMYVGFFFIYFGLRAYLLPRFPADTYNAPLGLNSGTIMIILGVLLFLTDFVLKKMK